MKTIQTHIDMLAGKYKYRPLPKSIRENTHKLYIGNLNGFDIARDCKIDDVRICLGYNRVVIGDYGAYVEIEEEAILQQFTVANGQAWRLDESYIESRGLSIKYQWLEFRGRKVYKQLGTVKYADYKPGKYYISVLDFDTCD